MVLVTGGSGLIGSFLIETLLARGYEVRAIYRNQIPQFPGAAQAQWVEGDVLDPLLLRDALEGITHVFHCAGLVSYAPQDKELLKQVNIEGTANIVNACLLHESIKLCHVSSIAAIGRSRTTDLLTEKNKWDPSDEHSAYASSKYFGELEVWRGISEGLNAVIVNPSVVLGPADWNRSSTQLFKYVYRQRPFYTDGKANFVDVRDVVEAMLRLTFSDISGERFILSSEQVSYKDFFSQVAACFGKKAPAVKVPPAVSEIIWRAEHLRAIVTGSRPLITKETARVAAKSHLFSNRKVCKATGMEFIPVADSIKWCCAQLMKDFPVAATPAR